MRHAARQRLGGAFKRNAVARHARYLEATAVRESRALFPFEVELMIDGVDVATLAMVAPHWVWGVVGGSTLRRLENSAPPHSERERKERVAYDSLWKTGKIKSSVGYLWNDALQTSFSSLDQARAAYQKRLEESRFQVIPPNPWNYLVGYTNEHDGASGEDLYAFTLVYNPRLGWGVLDTSFENATLPHGASREAQERFVEAQLAYQVMRGFGLIQGRGIVRVLNAGPKLRYDDQHRDPYMHLNDVRLAIEAHQDANADRPGGGAPEVPQVAPTVPAPAPRRSPAQQAWKFNRRAAKRR